MRFHSVWAASAMMVFALSASALEPASEVDKLLAKENSGRKVQETPLLDDLGFLRRVTVDLIGRIPTEDEIQHYLAIPVDQRRAKTVDALIKNERFTDRWTVFLSDLLRIRSNAEGGSAYLAFVYRAVETGMPYDVMVRQLLTATGKAGVTAEVGYILSDAADPMALASATAQVLLGVRISCAQCHNHPFDVWKRKQFYDLAAFFGKTRRVEHRIGQRLIGVSLSEEAQSTILWPPEEKANGKERTQVKAAFPFKLDEADGPNKHIARLTELRAKQEAAAKGIKTKAPSVDDLLNEASAKADKSAKGTQNVGLDVAEEARRAAKNLDVQKDIYRASKLRIELSQFLTDPRNRYFSRNLANRLWGELLGRGFVNPVDDFRDDNPPSHVQTLDYLADEFVASGFDFRTVIRMIVLSQAYQRTQLAPSVSPVVRRESETAFVATARRRMISEALYDSIVQAGHLFSVKHRAGENMTTVTSYVQVPVEAKEDPKKSKNKKLDKQPAAVVVAKPARPAAYDLERSIEVDFKAALKKKDGSPNVEAMERMSDEELEAQQMMAMKAPGNGMKYITKEVKSIVDDNPRFTSSMRMASPAPVGHFLRVFGQPERLSLDDRREHSPSMRQALMMLNGKLTSEAARVGVLEPIYQLMEGDKADLDKAISLAYLEILTREPTALERGEAKTILGEAKTPLDGMADLRWALFNCHEFRLLP